MVSKEEKNTAFLTHLSGFGSLIFPFGGVIVPLIIWQSKKDGSDFVDANGKEAINFNISYLLYVVLLGISSVPFFIGSFFNNIKNEIIDLDDIHFNFDFSSNHFFGIFSIASLISVLAIAKIVLIIMAAISAQKGEKTKYPLTIKFIK